MKKKSLLRLIIVFLLFFFGALAIQLLACSILNYNVDTLDSSQSLIITAIGDFVLAIILVSMYFKDLKEDFVKMKKDFNKNIDVGFKYWILGLVIMIVSNIVIGLFLTKAQANNEESVQELIKGSSALALITIGIIGPIIEEITFRKTFRDLIKNDTLFILISGIIFAAMHVVLSLHSAWDLVYIIPYSSLGIAFGKIYQETDNIFTSMIMHMFHNTVLTSLSIIGAGVIIWM